MLPESLRLDDADVAGTRDKLLLHGVLGDTVIFLRNAVLLKICGVFLALGVFAYFSFYFRQTSEEIPA